MAMIQGSLYCVEVVQFIERQTSYFCIWYSADKDALLTAEGSLLCFDTAAQAQSAAQAQFPAYEKIVACEPYDLDQLAQMIEHRLALDPSFVLTMWNLMGDVAGSLGLPFAGGSRTALIDGIYDKLFFGNNLPAMHAPTYVPVFTERERRKLDKILQDGSNMIKNALHA